MRDNILVRLAVYYVVGILALSGLLRVFPVITDCILEERARQGQQFSLTSPGATHLPDDTVDVDQLFSARRAIPVVASLVLSFVVTVPVAWVYRWTRPRKRYNQAFAHTLLVVPAAIALVVFLVKGSLALAFSLAGIVAAVRFRTSLNEPMDAVYMFIVIGIGLAAGVQLLVVALLASLIFNAIALTVWRMDYGGQPAILSGWNIVQPAETGQLLGVSGTVQPDVDVDGGKKKPFNAQLRIHTTNVRAAQDAATPILEASAKAWQMGQVFQKEDGTSVVEFDVRLKKTTDLAAFIKEIERAEASHARKVELTSSAVGKI